MLALSLAIGLMGLEGYLVYDKHIKKLESNRVMIKPIKLPPIGSAECFHNSASARLEPPDGTFLLGFSLDWNKDRPQRLIDRADVRPAMFNAFIKLTATDFQKDDITWHSQLAALAGAMLQLTIDPAIAIQDIPDSQYLLIAQHLRDMHIRYGTPILIRFGHEMNGGWNLGRYGNQPIEFRNAFVTLARYVRANTNMTAMMWGPNTGAGYPYGYPQTDPLFPKANDPDPIKRANFNAMDTNGDGVVNEFDNPYSPYYPGDEWVDWVGMSLYGTLERRDWAQTIPAPEQFMEGAFAGSRNGIPSFYATYAQAKNKPFVFCETGASFQTNLVQDIVKGDTSVQIQLEIKKAWWNNLFNLALGPKYPKFKGAFWFEESKEEGSFTVRGGRVNKDYRITWDSVVMKDFVADLLDYETKTNLKQYESRISYANGTKVACDGTLTLGIYKPPAK